MARRTDYKFLQLQDAHTSINKKVNIMAIILEFGFPKSTKGTDECCILRIIDDTHHRTGVTVIVFAADVKRLPRVAAPGDIIHLRNVVVRTHDGEVNVVFDKSSSSFALYKGEDNDDFAPYQVYPTFHPRDVDQMFVDKLRKWLFNFQLREESSDFPMFREIKEGLFNLAGKILHYCKAEGKWFLFVWDGTDAPPNSIYSMLEDEINRPLPLQLEPLPLPRDLLCTLPTVGSILRLTFNMPIKDNQLHVLEVGKWVKFVDLRLKVHKGLWFGAFTPSTRLRYTPKEDCLIIERLRLYDKRISLESRTMHGNLPQSIGSLARSLCITEVNHDNMQHSTLMDVLTHSEVTGKFKCCVRVIAANPYQAEKLWSPKGEYGMMLTLEDPTARIHAFVVGEDGETLFGGYPGLQNLRRKLKMLLGVAGESDDSIWWAEDPPRDPPWVSVCIKSYYGPKTDVWGTRKFRIFDTKIVG